MTPVPFDQIRDVALTSDEDVLSLVADLLERATRRQGWLLFLDARRCPIPLLLPVDLPRRPRSEDGRAFARFLNEVVAEVGAGAWIFALERRGDDVVTETDRVWLRVAGDAAAGCDRPLRGPLLVHDTGVRWIGAQDRVEPDQSVEPGQI